MARRIRRHRRRRARTRHNPVRRYYNPRRRRIRFFNPRHLRRRRRYRRNPPETIVLARPQTYVPQALTIGAASATAAAAPAILFGPGATVTQAYLTQFGTGLAGLFALPAVGLSSGLGYLWALGSWAPIVWDAVIRYIASPLGITLFGGGQSPAVSAYPRRYAVGQGRPYYPPSGSRYPFYYPAYGQAGTIMRRAGV